MPSRFSFIMYLMAAALFVAACSTTTVVAGDERAIEPTVSPAPQDDDDPADSTDVDSGDEDTDEDTDGDGDLVDADPASTAEVEAIEGFGLGGAEQLVGLLADCEDGSDLACDVMFQLSGFDTVEESTALTCGGRSEVEVFFCTPGIDPSPGELAFDIGSEGLDAVVTRCEVNGDMTACDFLYYRSPLASSFEEIGATCGGRVEVAVPDCRTFLAEDADT